MKNECTWPELQTIAKRKVVECCTHICPVHGTHSIKNYKVVGDAPTI